MDKFTDEQLKTAKTRQYNQGYDGTSERGTLGLRATLANCWDSGKEDKKAGKEKTPRCGSEVLGGRRRRKTKRSKKHHKKTSRKH